MDGWFPVPVASSSSPEVQYVVHVNPWGPASENVCECKAYIFRGHCRHQDIASESLCAWQEGISKEVQTDMQRNMMQCPRCGKATRYEMVAE